MEIVGNSQVTERKDEKRQEGRKEGRKNTSPAVEMERNGWTNRRKRKRIENLTA